MHPTRLSASALVILLLAACAAPRAQSPARAATPADNVALLDQVEQELAQGDVEDARTLLVAVVPQRLDAAQRLRHQLVQAEVAVAEDKPIIALQALPAARQLRDPLLAARAEAARAQALFRMGDPVGATQALLARERLLPETERAANRAFLWSGLRTTELDTAGGARLAQADRAARGWIELALISRSVWLNPHDLDARLQQWQADYPGHPASAHLGEIPRPEALPSRRAVESVALLLPLSGPYRASAEAVRDGFLAAFYAHGGNAPRPTARIYDTGTTPDTMEAAYREALDDGAEFLVGPLRREDVTALAESGRPPVPVLALNYLDPDRQAPFNFFQWGLAPEDEARQAAERAVTQHEYRAVALVPQGDWGERVLRAFRERLESLGGRVVGTQAYVPEDRDHSVAIRALLAIEASEQRHAALTNVLGAKTHFQPRRREDVDLIFLAARADHARLLAPQLRFHRSGELPIYATSLVYDGEPPSPDLDGLRFCDMPWMVTDEGEWAALRSQLRTLFPARPREYSRLLALGYDAYRLVSLIDSGQLQGGTYFPAASGTLSLRPDGAISRGLACVEIHKGGVRSLDAVASRR